MATDAAAPDVLIAPHVLEYTYTRSTGPVIGAFLGALRERRIFGVRGSDGRVIVPPSDYDPVTAETLSELVEVADRGRVLTWSWNPRPRLGQPLGTAFAWALVLLDGADTAMLVAVDVEAPASMRTGMRLRANWPAEPTGTIHACARFVPEDSA